MKRTVCRALLLFATVVITLVGPAVAPGKVLDQDSGGPEHWPDVEGVAKKPKVVRIQAITEPRSVHVSYAVNCPRLVDLGPLGSYVTYDGGAHTFDRLAPFTQNLVLPKRKETKCTIDAHGYYQDNTAVGLTLVLSARQR